MTAVIAVALTLVAVTATAVVLTPDPARQAATLSVYVLVLSVLFFVLQASSCSRHRTWHSPRSRWARPSHPSWCC